MWKSCGKSRLSAGLAPRSVPLINRFAQKQQWQFVLACGVTCYRQHGNQLLLPLKELLKTVASARLKSAAHFLLPRRCPEPASLLQVLPLLEPLSNDVLGCMSMRLAVLLWLALLSPGVVYAHDSHKARASDKSQEVATAKAMRRVPEEATVTDTSFKKLNYVF